MALLMTGWGLLGGLWTASLMMAAASVLFMTGLVVARLIREAGRAGRRDRREALVADVMSAMDGEADAARLKSEVREPRLVARALLELSTLIRGRELAAVTAALTRAGAEPALLRLMGSRNGEDQIAACEALGLFPSDKAAAALKKRLRRRSSMRVRIAAARALLQMGETPDLSDLLAAFDIGEIHAPLELSDILDEIARRAPDAYLERLKSGRDAPALRAMMVGVLGRLGRYEALPVLLGAASAPEPSVRAAALSALGALGHPDAEPVIAAGLDDPVPEVRAEACEAAGRTALTALAAPLAERLDDDEWLVRFRAASALLRLGGAGGEALASAAAQASPRAMRTAQMVLAEAAA
jgi:HEAT repeat protein